jgi:hypothetical protein
MTRVRAADDFGTIRLRLEELRRERAQIYVEGPVRCSAVPHPKAEARQSAVPNRRIPVAVRRQLRLQFWNVRYPHARME